MNMDNSEVRIGPLSVEAGRTAAYVNALCGTVPVSLEVTITVSCGEKLMGRYITVERNVARLEFAEIRPLLC